MERTLEFRFSEQLFILDEGQEIAQWGLDIHIMYTLTTAAVAAGLSLKIIPTTFIFFLNKFQVGITLQ